MKNQTIISILGAALASGRAQSQVVKQPSQHLSRGEAKQLTHRASSPENYQKLAASFKQREESIQARDREYEKEADDYASGRRRAPKSPYRYGFVIEYRNEAVEYSLKAKARAKADYYTTLVQGGDGQIVHRFRVCGR